MKKIIWISAVILAVNVGLQSRALARSSGPFIGGGYQQPIMFTWKEQGIVAPNPGRNINLWPSFGAYFVAGYEFEKTDWFGIAFPLNWSFVRLNKREWVHLINADGEAIFHLADQEKKYDPYISGIIGFNFMTEGSMANESQSLGPDFGIGLGFKYSIMEYARAGSPIIKNLSFAAEVPVKIILFLNDRDLSDSAMTPIISIPVRLGLTYTF